jgi:hypothetical protein
MRWNRTQATAPESSYDRAAGNPLERRFLPMPGEILGTVRDGTGDACDRPRIDNPDLRDLVEMGALSRTGARQHPRYRLRLSAR